MIYLAMAWFYMEQDFPDYITSYSVWCIHFFVLHVRKPSFHSKGHIRKVAQGKVKTKTRCEMFLHESEQLFFLFWLFSFKTYSRFLFLFFIRSSVPNLKSNGICLHVCSLGKRNSFFKSSCKPCLNIYPSYQLKIEKAWTEKRLKIHQRLLQWKDDKYIRTVKNMNQMSKDMILIWF